MPYLAHLLPPLTNKLAQAAKNPTRPHYNHYLFESLSLAIRIVCKSNPGAVASFEQVFSTTDNNINNQHSLINLPSGPVPSFRGDFEERRAGVRAVLLPDHVLDAGAARRGLCAPALHGALLLPAQPRATRPARRDAARLLPRQPEGQRLVQQRLDKGSQGQAVDQLGILQLQADGCATGEGARTHERRWGRLA